MFGIIRELLVGVLVKGLVQQLGQLNQWLRLVSYGTEVGKVESTTRSKWIFYLHCTFMQ